MSFQDVWIAGIVGFLGGVASIVIGQWVYDSLHSPKLVLSPRGKDIDNFTQKIGFYVSVKRKGVDDATPFCNDIQYDWEAEDGQTEPRKQLRVGEPSLAFYPFIVKAQWVKGEDLPNLPEPTVKLLHEKPSWNAADYEGGVWFLFSEAKSGRQFYSLIVPVLKGLKAFHVMNFGEGMIDFPAKVKVIAKSEDIGGKDYTKGISLTSLYVMGLTGGDIRFDFAFGGFMHSTIQK